MVQQSQFRGLPMEDPNLHLSVLLEREDKTLYEAWERFKELLRLCPHHGLQKWMVVQTFYNGVT